MRVGPWPWQRCSNCRSRRPKGHSHHRWHQMLATLASWRHGTMLFLAPLSLPRCTRQQSLRVRQCRVRLLARWRHPLRRTMASPSAAFLNLVWLLQTGFPSWLRWAPPASPIWVVHWRVRFAEIHLEAATTGWWALCRLSVGNSSGNSLHHRAMRPSQCSFRRSSPDRLAGPCPRNRLPTSSCSPLRPMMNLRLVDLWLQFLLQMAASHP